MYTAKAVSFLPVSRAMSHVWGEALWTAPVLAEVEYQKRLEAMAAKLLFGVSMERCLEAAERP